MAKHEAAEAALPRTLRMDIRVSPAEYAAFKRKAREAGQPLSGFIRDALRGVAIQHHESKNLLRDWLREHTRVNTNINEIAKYCHTFREAADAEQVALYLYGCKQATDALLAEVRQAL